MAFLKILAEKLPCPNCGWNLWKGRCLNPFCSLFKPD